MRALIVDDEEPAREEMRWLLEQCDGVEVAGAATDFEDAKERFEGRLSDDGIDVVFLDIDMPGVDGVRVAEWLESADVTVVFVTAYEEYAVDAFGVGAMDYLLKPVRLERLQKTLARVRERLADGGNEIASNDAAGAASAQVVSPSDDGESSESLRRLSVRPIQETGETDDNAAFRVIDLKDVLFLEADQGQVALQTDEGRFRADFRLKDLEKRLNDEDFVKCHRSYVVRVSAIEAIKPVGDGRYRLVIDSVADLEVPLARSRAADLKTKMPWSASLLDEEK